MAVNSCKKNSFDCAHLSCGVVNNLLCSQVALVSDKKLVHVFARIAIDFLQPLLDIVERLLFINRAVNHSINTDVFTGTAGTSMS